MAGTSKIPRQGVVQVTNSPNSVIQQRNLFLIGIYLN